MSCTSGAGASRRGARAAGGSGGASKAGSKRGSWRSRPRAAVAGTRSRAGGGVMCSAAWPMRSSCCRLSGAIASTSTPSAQGLVDITTASSPKACLTRARASRDVRAVKRFKFMPCLQ